MVKYYINDEQVDKVRFPVTEIGTKNTVTVTLENNYGEIIELIPYVGDMEVECKSYPRKLNPGETGTSKWTFKPTKERLKNKEGMGKQISLKCECGFKEIIG